MDFRELEDDGPRYDEAVLNRVKSKLRR